jgi:hypothetical protein
MDGGRAWNPDKQVWDALNLPLVVCGSKKSSNRGKVGQEGRRLHLYVSQQYTEFAMQVFGILRKETQLWGFPSS